MIRLREKSQEDGFEEAHLMTKGTNDSEKGWENVWFCGTWGMMCAYSSDHVECDCLYWGYT